MNVDVDTVQRAIQSYAVLFNRAQWLDESRLLMQETIWRRLVKRHGGYGVVTLDQFERAMGQLLQTERMYDVSVATIVTAACEICAIENNLVGCLYAAWEAGEPMLLDITSRAMAVGDVDELHREAAVRSRLLASSNLDGREVEAMLGEIRVEVGAVEDALRDRPELTGQPEEADDVIAEWLQPPPAT